MRALPLSKPSLRRVFTRATSSAAIGQAGWITGMFAILQALRLATNIVLAHLLSPAIFGVMALINALRTGVELLTDVGIGQNIVVNARGDEPSFYNTAWTIQILRGVGLSLIGVLAAWPIAMLYENSSLFPILLVCSTIFILTGVNSPARFLMQRRRVVRNLSLLDACNQVSGMAVSIGFALVMPTVWGMTLALIASSAITAAISYLLIDVRTLSLRLAREHVGEILHFGKWIFASSVVFFAATNFDRLYLPTHIPLALFGVYGIARSMSDLATQFMQRIGAAIVFPAVAREQATLQDRMPRVVKLRTAGLALASVALGAGIAISDVFVVVAYDDRYLAASVLLPMLLFGAWFSVHAAIADAVLLGLARPSRGAAANFVKLVTIVALVTAALAHGDVFVAFAILALADVPRYAVLLVAQHRADLRFGLHDLGLFVLLLLTAAGCRAALAGLGLVDGFVSSAQRAEFAILWSTVSI